MKTTKKYIRRHSPLKPVKITRHCRTYTIRAFAHVTFEKRRIEVVGRGRTLKAAWARFEAEAGWAGARRRMYQPV